VFVFQQPSTACLSILSEIPLFIRAIHELPFSSRLAIPFGGRGNPAPTVPGYRYVGFSFHDIAVFYVNELSLINPFLISFF
jgi:hypothetical protein